MIQRRAAAAENVSPNVQSFDSHRARKMSTTSWKSVKSMTSWKSCLSKQSEDSDSDYGSKSDGTKTRSNSGLSIRTRKDSNVSRKVSRRESVSISRFVTVSDVRVQVLNEMAKNRDKFYASDFNRIETNDWFIQRHILDAEDGQIMAHTSSVSHSLSVANVSRQILSMLMWKREVNIHDTSKFAAEFFGAGILSFGRDPQFNQLYLYIRGGLLKSVPGWTDVFVSFVCYIINLLETERLLPGEKLSVIVDCSGVGTSTLDVGLVFKMLPILLKYYPSACLKYTIHELPWFFRPLLAVILKLVPSKYQKILQLSTKKNVHDLFNIDTLPYYMGGNMVPDMFDVPDGTASISELASRFNISKSNEDKLNDYINWLNERRKQSKSLENIAKAK